MNIWSEVITALRGGMDEVGEAMEIHQAIEILDEQISQVRQTVQEQKEALAKTLISKKNAEQQIKMLQPEIEKYEGYAVQALEQDDDVLALQVAEQIAILEAEQHEQEALEQESHVQCEKLRQKIRQTEQDLHRLKHQRDTVKASTNVQNAQQTMSVKTDGNTTKIQTAKDVLERLKKQSIQSNHDESDLQSKLKKAGIIDIDEEVNANAVLTRIKGKAQ